MNIRKIMKRNDKKINRFNIKLSNKMIWESYLDSKAFNKLRRIIDETIEDD